jgi:hypothetical protein
MTIRESMREIRFDGKLIRKDGVFLPKALAKLNG